MELGVNLHNVSKQCRLFRSAVRFCGQLLFHEANRVPENPQLVQAYFNILNNINAYFNILNNINAYFNILNNINAYFNILNNINAYFNILNNINLLKTKRNLLSIRHQCIPRFKPLSTTVIKTNQLMMYKAKTAVCSEIRTKHSMQSDHHVAFLMLNLVVRKEIARV